MAAKQIVFDKQRIGEWACARMDAEFGGASQAIGLEQDGVLLAGVLFDNYISGSVCMHVAAEPGARWMTRSFLWVCFDYPFNQLRVNKILGLVDSTNLLARRFDEHLGFVLEHAIEDAGRCGDLLIYSMTRQQCRFLEMGTVHGKIQSSSSA